MLSNYVSSKKSVDNKVKRLTKSSQRKSLLTEDVYEAARQECADKHGRRIARNNPLDLSTKFLEATYSNFTG
jgi:hypothetical protein